MYVMVRAMWVLGLALLVVSVAAGVARSSSASPSASRIIDRTFSCSVERLVGGYPDRYVVQAVRIGISRATKTYPGSVGLSDRGADESLAAFRRGPTAGQLTGGIWVNARRCAPARASVPLSPQGLPSRPSRYGRFECSGFGRILVRVRARATRPASWLQRQGLFMVTGTLRDATLAVRTLPTRRPVPFAFLDGRDARLYVSRRSPRCTALGS